MKSAIASLILLLAGTAVRADDVEPASLFPAGSVAYLELAKPAAVADTVAGWLKNSTLADPEKRTHDRLDAQQSPLEQAAIRAVARFAVHLGPDGLAEFKRLRGAGLAISGFDAHHRPTFAAALLLGEARTYAFAARNILTAGQGMRRVAVVDGVPIYQFRGALGPYHGENGEPLASDDERNPLRGHKPTPAPGVPTFALVPGLLAVGSGVPEVTDVLKRFKTPSTPNSLAASPAFRNAVVHRSTPGLFAYLDVAGLLGKVDAARKAGGQVIDPMWAAALRFGLNPAAVPVLAAQLTPKADSLALSILAASERPSDSPLLASLAGPAVPAEIFRAIPSDAAWHLALSTPPKPERAKAVAKLLDAVARANGVAGRLPSEVLAAPEVGFDPMADLFPTVTAVAAFRPAKQEIPRGSADWPGFVLLFESDAAAEAGLAALPKLAKLATAANPAPTASTEQVGAVKVTSVSSDGATLHAARDGNRLVLAADRNVAAAAVSGRTPPEATGEGVRVGRGSVRSVAFESSMAFAGKGLLAYLAPFPEGEMRIPPPAAPVDKDAPTPGKNLARAAAAFPPAEIRISRTAASTRFEIALAGLDTKLGPLADAFGIWLESGILDAAVRASGRGIIVEDR